MNLDFEKWNSNMREEETSAMFGDFDTLYGLDNVFKRTHELFKDSYFYLADGTITPTLHKITDLHYIMDIEPGVWTGHLGGIEGLRQKGWTIFTVTILKHIASFEGTECRLMGQGDNQVLFLTFKRSSELTIQEQHDRFLEALTNFLSTIGPPLKPDESWSSATFFTYGKMPSLKGVPLSMSLKKLCRMFRLNNDDLVNLDSTLGSISSNAASATKMSMTPIVPFVVSLFEILGAAYNYLAYPFYHSSLERRLNIRGNNMILSTPTNTGKRSNTLFRVPDWLTGSHDSLLLMSMIIISTPSALGGFSVTLFNELYLHGFPDPVTLSINEVHNQLRGTPESRKILISALLSILTPQFNPEINPILLMENPTSLNLLQCSRCKDRVRTLVFDRLSSMTNIVNRPFLEMLSHAQVKQDELAEALFQMTPLKPRVANSIFESTVPSQAMSMVRRVDRTSTLINLTAKTLDKEAYLANQDMEDGFEGPSKRTFLQIFSDFESQHMVSVLSASLNPNTNVDNAFACSGVLADDWRTESWQKKLEGVTVPFPSENFIRCPDPRTCRQEHPNQDLGYILVLCHTKKPDLKTLTTKLGPFKPFFGSATKEKVSYDGKQLVKVAPPILKQALENLRFINWGTSPDSQLARLIKGILSEMTDADPDALIPSPGQDTGTDAHRWANSRTSHEATISVSYLPSTHFCVNTNHFTPENLEVMEGR